MGAPRTLAERLLRAMVRLAPEESRDWANAMLAELDFIEGDWTALFWALGSATAILRHASAGWRRWISRKQRSEEGRMNSTGKKAISFASGALLALMLSLSVFGLQVLLAMLFPGLGLLRMQWTHLIAVVFVPEIVFVVSAILLWRKRTPVAAGILLTAVVMGMHVAIHFAMR
jgi:hypothetical protein